MINLFKKFQYRIVQATKKEVYEVQLKRRFHWNWERYTYFNNFERAEKFVKKNIREDTHTYEFIVNY